MTLAGVDAGDGGQEGELIKTAPVAVRALCEFTAKRGDLDLRFTPAPTALEGIEGHQRVAARRPATHVCEWPLTGVLQGGLRVRGRADGHDPTMGYLEEVKTHKGPLSRQPANHRHLHWAQLKLYGALLCLQDHRSGIDLRLVYLDVTSGQETVFPEHHTSEALQAFANEQARTYLSWARQEAAHRRARDAALSALPFPHEGFREGQRDLAEAVYKVNRAGRCLLAEAPTGIGKTMATLFAQLRSMADQQLDKVFFLTAKTSGRALALQALHTLHKASAPPLRSLELVARDKCCEHPDKACHGASCPLAQGFYDRLPHARQAAVDQASNGPLEAGVVRQVALGHGVCPYYLAQELVRWADVVVGDYNHFFDLHAMLFSLTQAHEWKVALLVDEAHNLVERARRMYGAELRQIGLTAAVAAFKAMPKKPSGPKAPKAPKGSLQSFLRVWKQLNEAQAHPYTAHGNETEALHPLPDLPADWLAGLQTTVATLGEYLVALDNPLEHDESRPGLLPGRPDPVPEALRNFYLEALHMQRMAEGFDEHSLCDLTVQVRPSMSRSRDGGFTTALNLRNVVPAVHLKSRWAVVHSATLFSGTLQPLMHMRQLLGLPENTAMLTVGSPFSSAQLRVEVAHGVSTRFAHRAQSLSTLVSCMASQFQGQPGNYLAFASSHAYLQQMVSALRQAHPDIPVWVQERGMSEAAQRDFVQSFKEDGRGIGFAVLGGSFGEGIDLPGKRLIGAFIATLGLAQVNPVNERMRQRLDELGVYGKGYDAIYLYPGLQKVVQAAGRVIRTTSDQGVLHLMDERFGRAEVVRLLPGWWAGEGWLQPLTAFGRVTEQSRKQSFSAPPMCKWRGT